MSSFIKNYSYNMQGSGLATWRDRKKWWNTNIVFYVHSLLGGNKVYCLVCIFCYLSKNSPEDVVRNKRSGYF